MNWSTILTVGLLSNGLVLAMPTALAAVGETFAQRAGALNLGLEGMLLAAAFASFVVAYHTENVVIGVLAGIGTGMVVGLLEAFLSVYLKTDQVINGIAIVLVAQGLTAFGYERLLAQGSTAPEVGALRELAIPGLEKIPLLGEALFRQNALFYFSFVVVVVLTFVLYRSKFGLTVRAVGDHPRAADSVAINVDLVRTAALLVCGALTGLGGAMLIIGDVSLFGLNITAGRGWVAIALVILGRWNPLVVFGGALLFGILDALQLQIQAATGGSNSAVPFEAFQALPYILTLVVMVVSTVIAKRSAEPAALGIPYRKEVMD